MKTQLFALSFLFAAGTALAQTTQVINSKIRSEFQFYEFWTNADNDDFSEDDPAMKIQVNLLPSGFEYDEICVTWHCDAPCSYSTIEPYWFSNYSYEEEIILFQLTAYESDNTDWCTYHSDDDYYWSGSSTALANWGRVTDSKETVWDIYNGGGPDPLYVFPTCTNFDAKLRVVWRYENGETLSNPLQFGSLTPGATIQHTGTNLPNPADLQFDLDMGWKDDGGNSSPDVFFSFSLNQASQVVISTDYAQTDFDTYLRLYNSQGATIATDDDSGTTGDGNKAVLTASLNPGTYRFMLEGYLNNTGSYKFTINTTYTSAAEEQFAPADWSVFPNPVKDYLTVNIQTGDLDAGARLSVLDLLGREVLAQDARPGTQELDLSALEAGVYAVQIRSGGASDVRKVVVE